MYLSLGKEACFLGLDEELSTPETSGVIIIPVPFEKTSSYKAGSSAGPAAILAASHQVELFDGDLGYEPCQAANGIATLSPLRVEDDDGQTVAKRVERVASYWLEQGKRVITLAGEHTGAVGAIRAHVNRSKQLTVLQLDAHSDTRETYFDNCWNHACTMARVMDFHQEIVQVGIRSEAIDERKRSQRMGLSVFRSASIRRDDKLGLDWVTPIVEACSPNVYVTFDCDVLDPSIMPATGTPEPGGLTWDQTDTLLSRLTQERNVIGFDVSELCPIAGISHPDFTVAKFVYRFIGHLFRESEFHVK